MLPKPPWKQSPKRHGPQVQKSKQAGLSHHGSRVLYVCLGVYVHVCTRGACVGVCTRERESLSQRLGGALLETRPA